MKYIKFFVVFAFVILTASHLDGMGKKAIDLVRRLDRRGLAKNNFSRAQGNAVRVFSNGHKQHNEKTRTLSGLGVCFVAAACAVSSDQKAPDFDDDFKPKKVKDDVWGCLEILKDHLANGVVCYPQKTIDFMIDKIAQVMLADGDGTIIKAVYDSLREHILSGRTIHPQLLVMVLSIKHDNPHHALLKAAIAKQIQFMKPQKLDCVVQSLYSMWESELAAYEEKSNAGWRLHAKELVLRREGQELNKFIRSLIAACGEINSSYAPDAELKALSSKLCTILEALEKNLDKIF